MPPQAGVNKMTLGEIPHELAELNSLEQQLVSQTIPFMKIVQAPKGQQAKLSGPVISVRSSPEVTTKTLPWPLAQSQIIGLKLKKRLGYKGYQSYQMVDLAKVERAFLKLKEVNPLYADIKLDASWQEQAGNDLAFLTKRQ